MTSEEVSNNSTEKCLVKDPEANEKICNRDIWNNNEKRCIFHCQDKPADKFKEFFLAELEHVNESDIIKTFEGFCFIFPNKIDLKNISFNKTVNFAKAQFGKGLCFERTKFGDGAYFGGAEFNDEVSFRFAKFGDRAYFGGAKFGDGANFEGARFGNRANFFFAKFGNWTSFSGAKFGDGANFGVIRFGNNTFFVDTKFGNNASFYEADFIDYDIDYNYEAVFSDETSFLGAEFGDQAKFRKVKFGHRLNFRDVRFNGEMIFEDIDFIKLFVINLDRIINFTNVNFERPNKVKIQKVDLSSFALIGSNVQNVDFLDCDFPKIGKRLAAFDEIYYSKKNHTKNNDSFLKRATLGEIEQLYRRLQFNFENNKSYAEAGDFYIGAMEMRRHQLAQNSNRLWRFLRQNVFSIIAWYRHISLYGERYSKTLIWMLTILFLFPGIYLLTGFDYPLTDHANTQYENINYDLSNKLNPSELTEDLFKAFIVSFYTFTFQRNAPYSLTTWSQILSIIESALSAILLALFLLAIRRRFRR